MNLPESIDGNLRVDLHCSEAKLVVECDGAPHFTDEGRMTDERRTSWLKSPDIEVIRITSHEIADDMQRVLKAIDSAIAKRKST